MSIEGTGLIFWGMVTMIMHAAIYVVGGLATVVTHHLVTNRGKGDHRA